MKATVKINNLPKEHFKYVVANIVSNELWFYGSFNRSNQAESVAKELGEYAIVCEVE